MKHVMLGFLLFCFAAFANAYHSGISETTTADANASCNAAFHSGCVDADTDHEEEHTHTASSSGFAAPAGTIGSSIVEIGLLALLVWFVFFRKLAHSERSSGPMRSCSR